MTLFAIIVGLALLVLGGERLVTGASGLAVARGVSSAVVGLTVVAAGTSLPELAVSLDSAITGSSDLAYGNVVGSNIFNVTLILGLTAIVRPLAVDGELVRLHWPAMLVAVLALQWMALDLFIGRLEGVALVVGFVAFTVFLVRRTPTARVDAAPLGSIPAPPMSAGRQVGWMVVGLALMVVGARALVWGTIEAAMALGLSERVVGLTVVALGTSLPELITSLMSAWRGNADIAITNLVGSNLFNATVIIGLTALVQPLSIPEQMVRVDGWCMVGAALLLLPLMRSQWRVSRAEGAVLVVVSLLYLGVLAR